MNKLKHFLYSLQKTWFGLLLLAGLVLILFFLCHRITNDSSDFSKNFFSVLVSLLCGIVVSLATFTIHTYTASISAYNHIVKLVTNSCQPLLEIIKQDPEAPVGELAKKYSEYLITYREICFLSEPLTYRKEFDMVSDQYKELVASLKEIQSSDQASQNLEGLKKVIQELAYGHFSNNASSATDAVEKGECVL